MDVGGAGFTLESVGGSKFKAREPISHDDRPAEAAELQGAGKMHGSQRVRATSCLDLPRGVIGKTFLEMVEPRGQEVSDSCV